MGSYEFIQTEDAFNRYYETLKTEGIALIALDIEGEFNLHQYGEKLCLVQIFDGIRRVIIDPFPLSSQTLQTLLGDEKIIKIMFDASSDASLLKNQHQIDLLSVLDLRIAVELLSFPKKNLHAVLHEVLGLNLESKSRFQRYNWTRRPLDPAAVEYALGDVIYLFDAKDRILSRLQEKGLYEEFLTRSIIQQNKDYRKNPADRHKNFKGYKRFSPGEKKMFKEIFYIRDRHARELNLPPNMVLENREIYSLLKDPTLINQVKFHPRIPGKTVRALQSEVAGLSSDR